MLKERLRKMEKVLYYSNKQNLCIAMPISEESYLVKEYDFYTIVFANRYGNLKHDSNDAFITSLMEYPCIEYVLSIHDNYIPTPRTYGCVCDVSQIYKVIDCMFVFWTYQKDNIFFYFENHKLCMLRQRGTDESFDLWKYPLGNIVKIAIELKTRSIDYRKEDPFYRLLRNYKCQDKSIVWLSDRDLLVRLKDKNYFVDTQNDDEMAQILINNILALKTDMDPSPYVMQQLNQVL